MAHNSLTLMKVQRGGFIIAGDNTYRSSAAADQIIYACTTIDEAMKFIGENIEGGITKAKESEQ